MGFIRPDSGHCTIFGRNVWKEAVQIHQRVAYAGRCESVAESDRWRSDRSLLRLQSQKDVKARDYRWNALIWTRRKSAARIRKEIGRRSHWWRLLPRRSVYSGRADIRFGSFDGEVFQDGLRERKRRQSVLLSSHILSEVEKLCDRVSIIRRERIIETGSMKNSGI